MTARRMLAIKTACERFEAHRDRLVLAVSGRESRVCLDALSECCQLWIEQTGGTLATARYRTELAALAVLVAERPYLTLLPTPAPKETAPMKFDIETAVSCLVCSAPGRVYLAGDGAFEAKCSSCYDHTEGSSGLAMSCGHGASASLAVADWIESQESALPPRFWPADSDWQVSFESERQAAWQMVGNFWGPTGSIAAE